MEKILLLRYGEIALKGKNRKWFEAQLMRNVLKALTPFGYQREDLILVYGRFFLKLKKEETNLGEIINSLQKVFGLISFSPAKLVPLKLEIIKEEALQELLSTDNSKQSFKVVTHRSFKDFPLTSPVLNQEVGGYLLQRTTPLRRVDIHKPDVVINIEIRKEGALIFSKTYPGLGGLPVGTSGKAVALISGGIDSPVASWLSLKRGVELIGVHFDSFPLTSERSTQKVIDLCNILSSYGGPLKLYLVYFTSIQKAIRQSCPEKLNIILMRRMMYRLAQEILIKEDALALVTGENLGQVASQTLPSLNVIGRVVNFPVLRPLISMDKEEIIKLAQKIGTYETSILPYEDCCTLFVPKHPETHPGLKKIEEAENKLDISFLINDSIARTKILRIQN